MLRIVLIVIGVVLAVVVCGGAVFILGPELFPGGPMADLPAVAQIPTATWTPSPRPPTTTFTPTVTLTPSETLTPSMTWTPLVATYTPSSTHTPTATFTPSLTFTPTDTPTFTPTFTDTPIPSYTPTEDQPAPAVVGVGADSGVVVPRDPRCSPTTTRITANVASNVGLYTITLNYVYNGGPGQVVEMTNIGENLYAASVGPFPEPGTVAYWVTMADNWGKWQSYTSQTLLVSDCDVAAIDAAEATAVYQAVEATALAEQGYNSGVDIFQARNIELTVPFNTAVTISYSAINGTQPYQYVRQTNPTNGSLSTIDGYSERYTPNSGFTGTDSYTYLALDAEGQVSTATVTLNVQDPTLVAKDATLATTQNTSNTYTFNLQATGGTKPHNTQYVSESENPAGTKITYTGNYTEGSDSTTFEYSVETSAGYIGDVTFRWQVSDNVGATDEGTVKLTIVGPAEIPILYDNGTNIYASSVDGSQTFFMTEGKHASWSPDGTRFVYSRNGVLAIYDIAAGSDELIQETAIITLSGTMSDWAPTANKIVFFDSDITPEPSLSVENSAGGPRHIILNTAQYQWPHWDIDDQTVYYQRDNGTDFDIYSINSLDGLSETPIVNVANVNEETPAISQDGAWLAYSADGILYIAKSDGADAAPIKDEDGVDVTGAYPSWSPDGSQLVYQGSDGQLWVINKDGTGNTSLGLSGTAPDWAW